MDSHVETTVLEPRRFAGYLQKLGSLASPWLDLAFPSECALCRAPLGARKDVQLCAACLQNVTTPADRQCRRCAATAPDEDVGKDDCRSCRGEKFTFEGAWALGAYAEILRSVVLRMKQPAGELLSLAVGRLLALRLQECQQESVPELVVPMPMFWRRRVIRGVNAPDILAEVIARGLGRPLRRALRFRRNVLQQNMLPRSKRHENMRGALAVFPGYHLADATVLLVDDVMTTGATANEAARCLKKAGAKEVHVAVAARTLGFD